MKMMLLSVTSVVYLVVSAAAGMDAPPQKGVHIFIDGKEMKPVHLRLNQGCSIDVGGAQALRISEGCFNTAITSQSADRN